MKKFLSLCSLFAVLAGSSISFAKDPIDTQIEKTGKLKTESLAEAIRYEKSKQAAADREARKSSPAAKTAKKPASDTQ